MNPWRPGDIKSGMCGHDPFVLPEPDEVDSGKDLEPCPGTSSGEGLKP